MAQTIPFFYKIRGVMEFDEKNIVEEISRFYSSEVVNSLIDSVTRKCWFDIIGKRRSETVHSSFIAWLLDSNESHKMGVQPSSLFLNMLTRRVYTVEQKQSMPDDLSFSVLTKKMKIANASSITEFQIKNGRVDILLTLSLLNNLKIDGKDYDCVRVVIENKVDSKEHDKQTETYHDYFSQNPKAGLTGCENPFYIYVFLTPASNDYLDYKTGSLPECEDKSYIQINYQDIYDSILLPLLSTSSLTEKTRMAIKEYIECLGVSFN